MEPTFFWQILTQDFETVIKNRYKGDAEFQDFKLSLKWRFLINSIFCIVSFVLVVLTYSWVYVLNFFENSFLISLLLIIIYLWVRFCIIFYRVEKIELAQCYQRQFKTKKWQFGDFIFAEPEPIQNGTAIRARIENSSGYVLYAIVRFPCGHFGFRGINNQNIDAEFDYPKAMYYNAQEFVSKKVENGEEKTVRENVECERDVNYAEKTTQGGTNWYPQEIEVPVYDIKHRCAACNNTTRAFNFRPVCLIGFRLRGNVQGYENTISNLRVV